MVEEVPVRACARRGQAVDLVLERAREARSQIIFTTVKGREAIFWQSPKTTRRSRPAVRVPARRAFGTKDLAFAVDTRERYPFRFAHQQATTYRRALPAGDYGVEHDGELLAMVERKVFSDLANTLVEGSLTYALAELATLDQAALVVEDRHGAVFKATHVSPGFLADVLDALQVRYPNVPNRVLRHTLPKWPLMIWTFTRCRRGTRYKLHAAWQQRLYGSRQVKHGGGTRRLRPDRNVQLEDYKSLTCGPPRHLTSTLRTAIVSTWARQRMTGFKSGSLPIASGFSRKRRRSPA